MCKSILFIHPRRPEVLAEVSTTPRLYWVGQYEERHARKWEWFFQVDLAPGIVYCIKRFIGGGEHTLTFLAVALVLTWINEHTVIGSFFFIGGGIFAAALGSPLSVLASVLVISNLPVYSDFILFLIGFAFLVAYIICLVFTLYCTVALVCALLLTLTELTCSRRPDEFKHYSGHGSV